MCGSVCVHVSVHVDLPTGGGGQVKLTTLLENDQQSTLGWKLPRTSTPSPPWKVNVAKSAFFTSATLVD